MTDTPDTEITRFAAMKTAKIMPTVAEIPYTYVAITVQLSDRDQIEFRREYEPLSVTAEHVLASLTAAVTDYLTRSE